MKNTKQFLAYLALLLLTASVLFAQDANKRSTFKKNDISNLVHGIQSDNEGLKRSSIYLAGKYEVQEVTDVLIAKLENEDNSQDRLLIALALYQIGNEAAYEAVKVLSVTDSNPKVRRISNAICKAFQEESNKFLVNLN